MSKNTNKSSASLVQLGEYNGNPIITLKRDEEDKYAFTFGAGKAALVVEHFEAIKAFSKANPPKTKSKAK
jgi:hypothetical protein